MRTMSKYDVQTERYDVRNGTVYCPKVLTFGKNIGQHKSFGANKMMYVSYVSYVFLMCAHPRARTHTHARTHTSHYKEEPNPGQEVRRGEVA